MGDRRDPAVLRKPGSPTTTGAGSLKSDRSIMEQIGVPDHKGWMRKRGERYNTWTSRYFVLKGPHLYWLKSSNPSVRVASYWVTLVVFTFYVSDFCRRPRSKDTSILLAFVLSRMRTLILGNMGSSLYTSRIVLTISAPISKWLSANG